MRTQRSLKNLIYGGLSQAVYSLLNFVVRFALIHTLGIEAVSLNGLFTEVIAVLSLAEMGVGSAIVYHLYAPLKDQDEERLAKLMNLFRSAYRLIALAIFVIGLVLLPFVHRLVSRMEIDLNYLRLIYFLFLLQTASSYLFSYKTALLNADQKVYVISQCTMAVRIVSTGLSIAFLTATKNYIVYLLIQIAAVLSTNIAISIRADRQYPFLKRRDRLPAAEKKEVLSNVKYLFVVVLSGKITNSTDNILISTMVGTLRVGAYGSYTMIVNALNSILLQIHHATTGSIGNLVAEGDHCHTESVLRRLTFITYCPTVFSAVGIYVVSTPLIRLVFGEEYLLAMPVVFVCTMNFCIYLIKNPLWAVMSVSGLFAENKNISVTGDILNLFVSILLGKWLGIAGILLGTSCTLVVQHVLKTRLLFQRFLHLPARAYVSLISRELACCAVCMLTAQGVCAMLPIANPYWQIVVYGVCAELMAVGINMLFFYRMQEFDYAFKMGRAVLQMVLRRKKRQKG